MLLRRVAILSRIFKQRVAQVMDRQCIFRKVLCSKFFLHKISCCFRLICMLPEMVLLVLFVVQRDDPGLIIGILHGGNNFDRESVNGSTRGSLLQALFAVCYVFKNFDEEIQSSLTPNAKQFVANLMLLFILTRSLFTAWLFQVSSDI